MPKALKILVVEDNADDRARVRRELEGFFPDLHLIEAVDAAQFDRALDRERFDVVITAYRLPDTDGLQVLEKVRQSRPLCPVIMFTRYGCEEIAAEGIRAGLYDYLHKTPSEIPRLPLAVKSAVEKVRERRRRKRAETELKKSEELHRVILGNISDTVFIADDAGAFTYVSPSVGVIFGATAEEAMREGNIDWLLPRESFSEFDLTGREEVKNIECTIKDKQGRTRDLLVNVKKVDIQGGTRLYVCRDVTELREAESRLYETRARYERIFSRLHDAILIIDQEQRLIIDCNPAATRIFGYDRRELLGKSTEILYPDRVQFNRFAETYMPAIRRNESVNAELRLRRKDGSPVDVEVTITPLRDEKGWTSGVIGVMRDVTKRKRAETALSESTQRFQRLAENTPGMIFQYALRPDGRREFLYVSPGSRNIFGMEPEEILKNPEIPFERIHPEDCGEVERRLAHSAKTLEPATYEGRLVFDGRTRWAHVAARPARQPDGSIVWDGLLSDITQIMEAEEHVRRSEERFRRLAAATNDIVWTRDSSGEFTAPQPSWEAYTGQPWEKHRGWGWLEMIHPDYRERVREAWLGGARRGEIYEAEAPLHHAASEQYRYCLARAVPIPNPDGSIREWVGAVKDVENIRRAEEETKRLERQLIQSQKMESIGQLAGGVAHDFNNLLTAILGYGELAIAQLEPGHPLHRDLEEICRAGRRAAELTRQLLAFSRRQVLQPRVLDINASVRDMEKMLRRLIGENIELVCRLGEDLGSVEADPGQIEQVIMNLAVNARDAMPAGGRLLIATENVELDEAYTSHRPEVVKTGHYIMLSVSDTGQGMDEETRGKLFEPFFTTKGRGKGTGLGLATVYGIVKQSGGYIWVYSEPGRGSTFKIYLPRVDKRPEDVVKAPSSGDLRARAGECVALVEDEEAARKLAVRVLEHNGYKVLDFASGEELLRHARRHGLHCDLLLTDVVLPNIDGHRLARQLTRLKADLRVLYMSGYTEDSMLRKEVFESGAPFIQKPFTPKSLLIEVRKTLDAEAKPPRGKTKSR